MSNDSDKMLSLVRGIQYSHELLAKVEGIKTYVKQMRQAGEMDQTEYAALFKQLTTIEGTARDLIRDREKRFERAGGIFNSQPPKPEFYTTKAVK